ncbi:hypothetical protein KJ644_03570 [Candidatus Dependentiae bacterium]|nr:hypothetical protein [Candidatus Dependentiae bacterium]MBU4387526.1 hypothetical protein [Candidatus Dependentiae bacterium]MCG2756707.1 hypothetical protein [Candidatus Dependentiae bacterium]
MKNIKIYSALLLLILILNTKIFANSTNQIDYSFENNWGKYTVATAAILTAATIYYYHDKEKPQFIENILDTIKANPKKSIAIAAIISSGLISGYIYSKPNNQFISEIPWINDFLKSNGIKTIESVENVIKAFDLSLKNESMHNTTFDLCAKRAFNSDHRQTLYLIAYELYSLHIPKDISEINKNFTSQLKEKYNIKTTKDLHFFKTTVCEFDEEAEEYYTKNKLNFGLLHDELYGKYMDKSKYKKPKKII